MSKHDGRFPEPPYKTDEEYRSEAETMLPWWRAKAEGAEAKVKELEEEEVSLRGLLEDAETALGNLDLEELDSGESRFAREVLGRIRAKLATDQARPNEGKNG